MGNTGKRGVSGVVVVRAPHGGKRHADKEKHGCDKNKRMEERPAQRERKAGVSGTVQKVGGENIELN